MFAIDPFYEMPEMNFERAVEFVNNYRPNLCVALLDNLYYMRDLLEDQERYYEAKDMREDFEDNWAYEINAFNVVVKNMAKLF